MLIGRPGPYPGLAPGFFIFNFEFFGKPAVYLGKTQGNLLQPPSMAADLPGII
jgi:hypothetical protein